MELLEMIFDGLYEIADSFNNTLEDIGYKVPYDMNGVEQERELMKRSIQAELDAEMRIMNETDPYKRELYTRYLERGITDF